MHRVLVVEDQPDLRFATRMALSCSGFDVTTAATAAEAIEHLADTDFDIILCDVGLPDMDGVDLMRLIRARLNTPAIAFSAFHNLDAIYPDADSLFAARILKPASPEELDGTIHRVLGA